MLLLFHNRMWGEELPSGEQVPAGCELSSDRQRLVEADAVIFHVPELRPWHRPPKRPGQLWVAWSIESEQHYPVLDAPATRARYDLVMSYRRDADVIWGYVPFYSSADNLERTLLAPPRPKAAQRPVAMLISSQVDRSGRRAYARELMRHIEVDSWGSFLRNRRLASDDGRPSKLRLIASYPFTLAFENSISPDYVTEKFFDPLVVGSVPVYLGAANVADFAPGEDCYIDVRDHASPRDLAEYLHSLIRDPAAYERLHAWRRQPLRPTFRAWLDGQRTPPLHRLYEALRDRQAA